MIIVNDSHQNTFQMMVKGHDELQHPQAEMVQFKDIDFAKQFIQWLKVDIDFWSKYFVLKPDTMDQELAEMIMTGILHFGKLPPDYK